MATRPPIPTRLPEVDLTATPKLSDSHDPAMPGSGWDIYKEDCQSFLTIPGLIGFFKEIGYGSATETAVHADSPVKDLLKYDGVPKKATGDGAADYNQQRKNYIRRLKALGVAMLKRTLSADQRNACAPPGATDPTDVDALWANIQQYVQGADQENHAESIWNSIQEWQWPSVGAGGVAISPLSVTALTIAISTQREYVNRMGNASDDDYSYSIRQAIRMIISKSPAELSVFRRSHRECKTFLELQTRMAADMNDIRDSPPTGINALLAAAADQHHPDNARVLAAFRTLLAPGDRSGRFDTNNASKERRMDKTAGSPNGTDVYCKVHGWGRHGDNDCRVQQGRQ